jgi:hypothetical protein
MGIGGLRGRALRSEVIVLETNKNGAAKLPEPVYCEPLNLADHRRGRELSLEEIAESTKISMFFLRAIEAGEYGKLPGGIYRTSYVRQYAAAVGFDAATLLAHVTAATATPEMPATAAPNGRGVLERLFHLSARSLPNVKAIAENL